MEEQDSYSDGSTSSLLSSIATDPGHLSIPRRTRQGASIINPESNDDGNNNNMQNYAKKKSYRNTSDTNQVDLIFFFQLN